MSWKSKQKIEKLQSELYSLKWEKAEIHSSQLDPDIKGVYLSDVDYKAYIIEQEIEDLEFNNVMLPLRLMLAGFIIFTIAMFIYLIK